MLEQIHSTSWVYYILDGGRGRGKPNIDLFLEISLVVKSIKASHLWKHSDDYLLCRCREQSVKRSTQKHFQEALRCNKGIAPTLEGDETAVGCPVDARLVLRGERGQHTIKYLLIRHQSERFKEPLPSPFITGVILYNCVWGDLGV